mgnify:CR=1 FL=1
MNNNDATYDIPKANLPALREQFEKMVRKANRLGAEVPTLNIHEEFQQERVSPSGVKYMATFCKVSIVGEAPKLAGWSLVAVIEPLGDEVIVRTVPNEVCPEAYRKTTFHCDHCSTQRRRKEVFVLRHDEGTHKQVGRQCLSNFLGGLSPERLLSWYSFFSSAETLLGEAGNEDWGSAGEKTFNLELLLKTTAIVIRKLGWLSATKAREIAESGRPQMSTRDIVVMVLNPRSRHDHEFIKENALVPEERDAADTAAAIEWAAKLEGGTDYEHNLGAIARTGFAEWNQLGIAVSLLPSYLRHVERQAEFERERANKVRGYVGTVGERRGFEKLTVLGTHNFDSDFGVRTLVRFEDEVGNILTWWTGEVGEWLDKGNVVDVTGTVKKHDDYKGTKQTVLTRVAKGLPKPKGKKKCANKDAQKDIAA